MATDIATDWRVVAREAREWFTSRMTMPQTLDQRLRARLEMAGCYPKRQMPDGGEIWFTPHLNREFAVERRVTDTTTANAVLRRAGMEDAF